MAFFAWWPLQLAVGQKGYFLLNKTKNAAFCRKAEYLLLLMMMLKVYNCLIIRKKIAVYKVSVRCAKIK